MKDPKMKADSNVIGTEKSKGVDSPKETTDTDELSSDGSASAFEGTEAIDSHDQDLAVKRKNEILKNDPSGRSNY